MTVDPTPTATSPATQRGGRLSLVTHSVEKIARAHRWFTERYGLDLRSVALFRMGLAACVLTDLMMRSLDLRAFYTDEGIVPRERLLGAWGPKLFFSFHNWGGNVTSQALLFVLHAAFAVMLLVGYRTRLAVFMTWLLTASLHGRNYIILQGGDDLVRVMLFWSMFVPLSARYSVDAFVARERWGAPHAPARVLSLGTTVLVAQLLAVYVVTATLKTGPTWQEQGSAVYLALHHHAFVTRFGRLFAQLPVRVLQGVTWGVWWLETLGPLAFFVPFKTTVWRMAMVLAFMSFHFGLFLCMELGPFPWVAMACWLALLPSWFWDRALPWSVQRTGLATRLSRRSAYLSRFIEQLVERATPGFVAAPRARLTWVSTLLAGVLGSYAGYGTAYAASHGGSVQGKIFEPLLMSRLYANWGMFAPNPPSKSGWFVSVARQRGGREIDVWNGGRPVSWQEPELPSRTYRRERWRKFSDNIISNQHRVIRPYFLRWLCTEWNDEHASDGRVTEITLYHLAQTAQFPDKGYGPISKDQVGHERCPEAASGAN